MDGLMMSYPLTLRHLFDRVTTHFPDHEVVSRSPDRSIQRTTYRRFGERVVQLAGALRTLGVAPGDRVATLAWNHARHLEAYYAVPLSGAVLHTVNPRLSPTDIAHIISDAGDQVLLVDDVLLPVWEKVRALVQVREVVVMSDRPQGIPGTHDYESLLAAAPTRFEFPALAEEQAAGLCYTSGTTGRPKGVLYSHRSLALHALTASLPDQFGISQRDCVMPVVPMFHVNAWGLPFAAVLTGAKQVHPGPHLDAVSLLELIERERVTFTAGVPTVWLGVLQALDREPGRWNTSSLEQIIIGGAAAPPALIEAFEKRHGLQVVHAWGMTELSPIGTVCRLKPALDARPEAERLALRATQGLPVPFVETRVLSEAGPVARDGRSMGELHVRGPWVARSYFNEPAEAAKFTSDGWFRTGDVVTVEPDGYIRITDRTKDLIKSGGEWISSVQLEGALMGHPAVAEAAVVAVPHAQWDERPAACVVLKPGASSTADELRQFLAPQFAKFWLPDTFVFMEALPKTATGKCLKSALRAQLRASPAGAV
jgi:fatty-acyl-CoA synthase